MMATTQIALRVHVTAKICFPLKSRVLIPSVLYFYFSHTSGEGKCFNLTHISFSAKVILLVREVNFSSMPQTRSSHWKCSRTHCCCPCRTTHRFLVLHNFCNHRTPHKTLPSIPLLVLYSIILKFSWVVYFVFVLFFQGFVGVGFCFVFFLSF